MIYFKIVHPLDTQAMHLCIKMKFVIPGHELIEHMDVFIPISDYLVDFTYMMRYVINITEHPAHTLCTDSGCTSPHSRHVGLRTRDNVESLLEKGL